MWSARVVSSVMTTMFSASRLTPEGRAPRSTWPAICERPADRYHAAPAAAATTSAPAPARAIHDLRCFGLFVTIPLTWTGLITCVRRLISAAGTGYDTASKECIAHAGLCGSTRR